MHAAIDLGESNTYLACWDTSRPVSDAWIRVCIPGLAKFNSSTGGSVWNRDNLREYISHIYCEYLLPSRMVIESAALALPGIFDLNSRRLILDILEEILGLAEVMIIPHAIALVAGCQLRHQLPLSGDVMVLEAKETSFDFAFLSVVKGIGITLEKQFTGNLAQIMKQAEKHGYSSASGWRLDHVLLSGNSSNIPETAQLLASLPANINIISADLAFAAAEGLSAACIDNNLHPIGQMSMIYPYHFYLERFDPLLNTKTRFRIPFDTCNLELDWGSKYRLASLNSSVINSPTSAEAKVNFRIYEINADSDPDLHQPIPRSNLVLEIDSSINDLPPRIELELDMAASQLNIELNPQHPPTASFLSEAFWMHRKTSHEQLHELISTSKQNSIFLKDWDLLLSSPRHDLPALSEQVEKTSFHLYGLLQLWQG